MCSDWELTDSLFKVVSVLDSQKEEQQFSNDYATPGALAPLKVTQQHPQEVSGSVVKNRECREEQSFIVNFIWCQSASVIQIVRGCQSNVSALYYWKIFVYKRRTRRSKKSSITPQRQRCSLVLARHLANVYFETDKSGRNWSAKRSLCVWRSDK